jgi:DHA1 family L-arabinose/isopropyl-beta-D-thiogalactopyranoside export protein-like MFS transporter
LLPLSQGVFQLNSLALIWGISIIGFSLALQAKTLNLASDATDVAMAIFSGLYNVGIGGGALLGGLVTAHIGLHSIGWVGAILASLGFLISLYLIQRPDFLGKKAP